MTMFQPGVVIIRSCLKSILQTSVSRTAAVTVVPSRNTVILRRKYPARLHKKDKHPQLKAAQYVYELEEDTFRNPRSRMIEVLLTDHVDGVGLIGELVEVPKRLFRYELFPAGLAVYPTEENKLEVQEKMKEMKDEMAILTKLSKHSRLTAVKLMGCHVPIAMSGDNEWTLQPSHVKVALRKLGVMVKDDCITLPVEPITGPGEITFTLTINNVLPVLVRGTVYQVYKEKAKNVDLSLPEPWNNPPVNLEETPSVLKSLISKKLLQKPQH